MLILMSRLDISDKKGPILFIIAKKYHLSLNVVDNHQEIQHNIYTKVERM